MVFINTTGILGLALISGSTHLTGSETLTLLIFMMLLFIMGLAFKLPVVVSMLLITPFIIVLMAFNSAFLLIGGIFLFIEAGILAKTFFLG